VIAGGHWPHTWRLVTTKGRQRRRQRGLFDVVRTNLQDDDDNVGSENLSNAHGTPRPPTLTTTSQLWLWRTTRVTVPSTRIQLASSDQRSMKAVDAVRVGTIDRCFYLSTSVAHRSVRADWPSLRLSSRELTSHDVMGGRTTTDWQISKQAAQQLTVLKTPTTNIHNRRSFVRDIFSYFAVCDTLIVTAIRSVFTLQRI